jgi:hypothetical protein
MAEKEMGTCALTGEHGPFVDSHIIPRAFSKPAVPGQPLILWRGTAEPPGLRRNGVYDRALVTRAGEDILERYDAWAINEFRKHNMVWSAWGPRITVPPPHDNYGPLGHRIFDDIDPIPLRLYFASILWRAAASKRREVAQITIPQDHIDRIAESLRSGVPLDDTFYPVTLTQYSTMGHVHQANPIARLKKMYDNDGNFTFEIPIFRFYFDGLIAHFHISGGNEPLPDLGISGVGNYSRLCVHTIPFQESFQRLDLAKHVADSIVAWPEDSRKLISMFCGRDRK